MGGTIPSVGIVDFQRDLLARLNEAGKARNIGQLADAYVPITSSGDSWLVKASDIARIAMLGPITPVPGASAEILGVVSQSGMIYTLVDFNALLGRQPVHKSIKTRVIFLESTISSSSESLVALMVERVLELTEIDGIVSSDWTVVPPHKGASGWCVDVGGRKHYMANLRTLCAEPGMDTET